MNYYSDKEIQYFSNVRKDVIQLLPNNSQQKILEVGCGGGNTLVYLKETKTAAEVVGIELFEMPDSNQKHPAIDRLIFGNIEEFTPDLSPAYFDVIICADVLEHLIDPWSVVKKILPFLKQGGSLIVSVPNIQEFRSISKVLRGDFAYDPEGGILDKTHLRFFCKKNVYQLFDVPGLDIQGVWPSFLYNQDQKKLKWLNQATLGIFEGFLAIQYLAKATKQ